MGTLKKRILLVEDETIIAFTQKKIIEQYGFEVIIAGSGIQVIQMLEAPGGFNVDLILMDIDLGKGMEGTEAASQILEKHEVPIVFLTSHREKEVVEKVKDITRYGYVLKEAGEFVLIESINRAFELFYAHMETKRSKEKSQAYEAQLKRANRVLRIYKNCTHILNHETSELELFKKICREIISQAGYKMAWIGYVEHDAGKRIRPVAHAGFEEGYLDNVVITWDNTPLGSGPTGLCVKTGRPNVMAHILDDIRYEPWRKAALERGYKSSIALPIKENGAVFAALNIYAAEPDAFSGEEEELLVELTETIARGIQSIHLKEKKLQAERKLKKKEESYRLLAENSTDVILYLDANLHPLYLSPSAKKLSGYSIDDFKNRTVFDIIYHEDKDEIEKALEGYIKNRSEESSDIFRIVHKKGHLIWVEIKSKFFFDSQGNLENILINERDITDRMEDEIKIKGLLEEKELLLKEVHHRMKNDMNKINGILAMGALTEKSPQVKSVFKEAQKKITLMSRIYERLYMRNNFFTLPAGEFLHPLIDEFKKTCISSANINFTADIQEISIPARCAFPMGIIINELITNAYKYAFKGRNKGEIAIKVAGLAKGCLSLKIKDNGVGIPGHVIEDFSQGFGLPLVSAYVQQCKGTMQIKSDQGTEINIIMYCDEIY